MKEKENKMNNRYLVAKEDNQRIIANIVAKLDELYKTNRTLIGVIVVYGVYFYGTELIKIISEIS